MKVVKLIIAIAIPILIGIVTFIGIERFLDKNIKTMLEERDLTLITNVYGSVYKDKGIILNEYLSQNDVVTIQGSSELSSIVPQLPTRFFPIKGFDYDVVTNGRAYVQSLQHASLLGSQNVDLADSKVAIIVSLQWFERQEGIDCNSFASTFSPAQFYAYLNNKSISNELKTRYATRVSDILSDSSQYAPEKLYASMYIKENFISKIGKFALKPYYFIREKLVTAKDKGLLYRELKKLPIKDEPLERRDIDWQREKLKAEEEGKVASTNNDFYVDDNYYNQYISGNLESFKEISKDINLMVSKEYEDYQIYLDTCEELGIKPYVIIMPTNGLWYDYKGLTQEKRDEFYNKIEDIAREKNFEVLNLKDEEYTPYFMFDVMHLGWKGWLEVDEAIYNKFK